jgi:hypothetical protein
MAVHSPCVLPDQRLQACWKSAIRPAALCPTGGKHRATVRHSVTRPVRSPPECRRTPGQSMARAFCRRSAAVLTVGLEMQCAYRPAVPGRHRPWRRTTAGSTRRLRPTTNSPDALSRSKLSLVFASFCWIAESITVRGSREKAQVNKYPHLAYVWNEGDEIHDAGLVHVV